MPEYRIRVAPNTVAYADGEKNKLVVEFAIPGAPTDTIDVKILEGAASANASGFVLVNFQSFGRITRDSPAFGLSLLTSRLQRGCTIAYGPPRRPVGHYASRPLARQ